MQIPRTVLARVNGKPHELDASPDRSLLEVLREDLGLTGSHNGCGAGECGACAVLVDGVRTLSCRTLVESVAEKSILTIEGLADADSLHPVQQAFLDENAFQCGFCTSGMIMSVVGHLNENPQISDDELILKMDENLCRCCGYAKIAPAVRRAAEAVRTSGKGAMR